MKQTFANKLLLFALFFTVCGLNANEQPKVRKINALELFGFTDEVYAKSPKAYIERMREMTKSMRLQLDTKIQLQILTNYLRNYARGIKTLKRGIEAGHSQRLKYADLIEKSRVREESIRNRIANKQKQFLIGKHAYLVLPA